jgi:hypothetical protein
MKSTLARLGAKQVDLQFLFERLLPRWTHESGRGIPQGPWASSYIANALLDSVDKAMLQYGYTFLRYVDDMRIFCNDRTEAKRALLRLTELVRELGLTLQSSKTRILLPEEARKQWGGFEDVLANLEAEVAQELSELFTAIGAYFDTPEEQEQERLSAAAVSALERLFRTITEGPAENVDRTGLRFILNRLAASESDLAVPYCLSNLAEFPDLAPECANYLGHFSANVDFQRQMAAFIASNDCIYDWQAMHLAAALVEAPVICPELMTFCAKVAADRNRHFALRSVCIDLISRHGAYHLIQGLRRRFADEPIEEVRASIILACARLEASEKETFLRACRGIAPALDAAIQIALAR